MKKITKYVLISILLLLIIVFGIFIIIKNNQKDENINVNQSEDNINKNEVDENGVPYLYLEYGDYKIKSKNYDFSKFFDKSYDKITRDEEFNKYWSDFEDEDVITINDYNIYYVTVSSSNNQEFSVEEQAELEFEEGSPYIGRSWCAKDLLISSNKEMGNNITLGISHSNPEKLVLKIFKVHYEDIGDVYYAFRFKCIKKV